VIRISTDFLVSALPHQIVHRREIVDLMLPSSRNNLHNYRKKMFQKKVPKAKKKIEISTINQELGF
jgi:hypothetical protein